MKEHFIILTTLTLNYFCYYMLFGYFCIYVIIIYNYFFCHEVTPKWKKFSITRKINYCVNKLGALSQGWNFSCPPQDF